MCECTDLTFGMLAINSLKEFCASSIDWPAWVQALGSVAALILAVFLPSIQRVREENARYKKLVFGAMNLIDEMVLLTSKINRALCLPDPAGKVSKIHDAYKQAAEGLLSQLQHFTVLNVHDVELLNSLSLFRYLSQRTIDDIMVNWPEYKSDPGFEEVQKSIEVFEPEAKKIRDNIRGMLK